MQNISEKFENFIKKITSNLVKESKFIPIKTNGGILIGDVLIESTSNDKHIFKNNNLLYKNIMLNSVAIKIANLLAANQKTYLYKDLIYLDKEYKKWYEEYKIQRHLYHQAIAAGDYFRADIICAKMKESHCKVLKIKNEATTLCKKRIVQSQS